MTGTRKVGNGGTCNIKISLYKIAYGSVGVTIFESQTDGNRSGVCNLIYSENGSNFYDACIIIGFNFIRI